MSEVVVGRVEFCPKVYCGESVGIDTIAKRITEKLEQEMALRKGFFEKDEKRRRNSLYMLTYECGKEIKQEKIVAKSLEEALDNIIESDFVGFYTINGKALYIKTDNIVEIREYDDEQDNEKLKQK